MAQEQRAGADVGGVPPVIRVGSLTDLEVIETEIELRRPDGARLVVPVRSLTQDELVALRQQVRWPTPPAQLIPGEKGAKPRLVKDYEDPGYLDAQQRAASEYSYRVLLAALRIEVPGETDEAKLAALRARLGAWASAALAQALALMHGVTPEEIEAAAKN